MKNDKYPCKVCDSPTDVIFNINFKQVSICDSCADRITVQHVQDLIKKRGKG